MLLPLALAQAPLFLPYVDLVRAPPAAVGFARLAVTDADGDGALDVLFATGAEDDFVPVLYRAAATSFGAPSPLFPGETIGAIVPADLDGDGHVDLVLERVNSGLHVAWGDGAGGFALEPVPIAPVVFTLERAFEVIDIDTDGDLDVVFPDYNTPSVAESLGSRVFAVPRPLVVNGQGYDVSAMDLDGDGLPEVVSALDFHVTVHRNLGGLSFDPNTTAHASPGIFSHATAADLDGSGPLELMLSARYGDTLVIRDPLGSFDTLLTIDAPVVLAVDVDADADLDLVSFPATGGAEVHRNDGTASFAPAEPLTAFGSQRSVHAVAVDLDQDGLLDLVTPGRWLRGAPPAPGGLAFEASTRAFERRTGRRPDAVVLDADADGDVDVLVSARRGASHLLERLGQSGLASPQPADVEVGWNAVARDLDLDGFPDLVGRTEDAGLAWQRGGPAGFAPAVLIDALAFENDASAVRLTDLDGDGAPEALVVRRASMQFGTNEIVAAEWNGAGFGALSPVAASYPGVVDVLTTDVDGDGNADLVVHGYEGNENRLALFRGLGGGAFAPLDEFDSVTDPVRGLFLLGDSAAGTLALHAATGAGVRRYVWNGTTFVSASGMPIGHPEPDAVVVAEFRGAGRGVQTLSASGTSLVLVENGSTTNLGPIRSDYDRLEALDVDGDGDLDVVATSRTQRRATLFENTSFDGAGVVYCGAGSLNSTGAAGRLDARGDARAGANALELVAYDLPPAATALFLTSESGGFVPGVGGAAGTLCLGGQIGRFTAPGQIGTANGDGSTYLDLDLQALPQQAGFVSALAGDLWRFQCWYRDGAGSNLTEAIAVSIL